ncbi:MULTISPECIES: sn-glycerol-3-phosphate ABC transporter permease UgpE [Halomonas]|uniref:sn-glycerol-3-phosphate transport system permease protein UgpE n=1 Tax=Halomonas halophila TaxID=29573 RepID=A0ABQ0TZL1_9GAMM|nr:MULTISPECIES: sn-glycerol-3-phosphate ABC transporter permease UgpE [Halomonas]MDR5889691.1 sn-glycerol-3-phosphate ABC transporter permease UgpE [Halomonas salina]WJY06373.1 sn-glycerol-3-phosphate ABC transporter permease UgpE [Halomonas halophila]GEK71540.1 sn-glycerol-3-phosphate transport system permease protein UgpE [Halomonas halophila]
MRYRRRGLDIASHALLILALIAFCLPVWLAITAATHDQASLYTGTAPLWFGSEGLDNFRAVLTEPVGRLGTDVTRLLLNSTVMALGIALGKIAIAILAAYAIVFFRFPLRRLCFWLIFITLMLPVEVRIMPTYKVAADLGLLNSYVGLILPLIASATATFLFRQFYLTVPPELLEAARVDGAGPWRFLKDILLPLSTTNIAALFVIMFLYGWNQYLWPLLITTESDHMTIVVSLKRLLSSADNLVPWQTVMATALLAMLPPVAVIVLMQRYFVKGLVDAEK